MLAGNTQVPQHIYTSVTPNEAIWPIKALPALKSFPKFPFSLIIPVSSLASAHQLPRICLPLTLGEFTGAYKSISYSLRCGWKPGYFEVGMDGNKGIGKAEVRGGWHCSLNKMLRVESVSWGVAG